MVIRQVDRHFYVDNWLTSFDTEEEAIKTARDLVKSLHSGGFPLTQWCSSSREVLQEISPSSCEKPLVNLNPKEPYVERTLGLRWSPLQDVFLLAVNTPTGPTRTKRQLLSALAGFYDPLGFLCPVLLPLKLILREVWRDSVEWDETPSPLLLSRWTKWCSGLDSLSKLSLQRQFATPSPSPTWQLHVFCDASELGYGAAAYLRASSGVSTNVSFLMSKAR